MSKVVAQPFSLSQHHAWLLWGCQLINIGCLYTELSSWMLAILLLCLCWQALILSKVEPSKTKLTKFKPTGIKPTSIKPKVSISPLMLKVLAMAGCVAIALSAKGLGVLGAMIHLISFAYVLKSFELTTRKDFYQQVLLGLFIAAAALIFKQSLGFSLLIFAVIVVNLTVLHQFFVVESPIIKASKTVLLLLAQSSLLAIILFLVFPRLAPFWKVPLSNSAKTGLSEEVSPGDIAKLALSSELAFRVNFKGAGIPDYSQLYWRAMTLEHYDGRKWSRNKVSNNDRGRNTQTTDSFSPAVTGKAISYQLIAEASYQPWLFSLAVATSSEPAIIMNSDYTMNSTSLINQPTAFELTSYLESPLALTLSDASRRTNLRIIPGANPKLEQLAAQLTLKHPEPIAIAQAVLDNFNAQAYFYTLQPPRLINNNLDQFYFETKAGFCEHYASAFTYLMRAAGIPARVVTGYLGGEYNNVTTENGAGYLSIYQYDAHAWSEIWLEGIGWQRIDPTSAVDAERVNRGWSNSLLAQQSLLNSDLISLYHFKQFAWLNNLRLQLDALDYRWTRFVLGYSTKEQYTLLKRLFGETLPWKTALIVALCLVLTMAAGVLLQYLLQYKRKTQTPALKLYQQCINTLLRKGFIKEHYTSSQQFTAVISKALPELGHSFQQVSLTFEQLHYQRHTLVNETKLLAQLTKHVNDFNQKIKRL